MKKLWMLLSLIGLACTGRAQNVPSYVPTNGLVGWWPFNGNANDEGGNGNNGTVNGAILTSDRFGAIAKAYNFDGSDWIELNLLSSIDNSAQLAVSLWVKTTGLNSNTNCGIGCAQYYFSRGFDGGNGFNIYTTQGSSPSLSCNVNGPFNGGQGVVSPNSTPIPHTQWNHLLMNYDGINIKFYVNGILEGTAPYTATVGIGNTTNATFGRQFVPNYPYYAVGDIDDAAIWNRALTQQEITNLYNASTSAPAPCPTLPANLQNGLVGYWPFCGNANDESGNGNNGTVNGAALSSDRFGNSNRAYSFDGVNDYIEVANSPTLQNVEGFSISIWYKINQWQQVGNNSWFATIEKPSSYSLQLKKITTDSASVALTSIKHNENDWNNLIITYSNNIQKIYSNGVLMGRISNNYISSIESLFFGKDPGGLLEFTNGKLDDICIWNRALDSTEITQLYQTQSSNSSQGNVGINVVAPQRNLHVKDVIRLEPRSTPPDNPVFGDMYIDAVLKKLRVYDGTTWQNCW